MKWRSKSSSDRSAAPVVPYVGGTQNRAREREIFENFSFGGHFFKKDYWKNLQNLTLANRVFLGSKKSFPFSNFLQRESGGWMWGVMPAMEGFQWRFGGNNRTEYSGPSRTSAPQQQQFNKIKIVNSEKIFVNENNHWKNTTPSLFWLFKKRL